MNAASVAVRRGIRIEIVTLIYMSFEAALSILAGVLAHSVLLAAFGADSLIELLSGAILLWRLRVEAAQSAQSAPGDLGQVQKAEKRAAGWTAVLLGLLCVYILVTSIYGLAVHSQAESSLLGIAVSAAAVVFMPYLASQKKGIARELHSQALAEDATASITCAFMAGTVLAGLALNSLFHWWWVEDIAALVFLYWLVGETREAFETIRD